MPFFPAHERREARSGSADGRQRLAAGLVALAAQGLLAALLLPGTVHHTVPPPQGPPVVMLDVSGHPVPPAPVAPPLPRPVHVAPVTVKAPDITIQPEARAAPDPVPEGTAATSTLASAMAVAPSGAGAGAGAATAGGGGGGFDINPYLARVAAHIQGYLRLPYLPSRSVQLSMPQVIVHMVWRHDGTVELAEVARSSGHSRIDEAAVEAVVRAQPLPPFPPELKGERINGVIPVLFVYRWARP